MYRNKKNKELLIVEETQRRELENLDRLKSRFFNNISHEFRTPLTLILGPIGELRKSINESLHPTLEVMERNGKRLLKLVNQLLDLSKIESGKVSLKTALVDLVPLVKGWAMSFHSIAETKGIELSITTQQDSHFVYLDGGKIEEVVLNLLSNAFRYTPKGGKVSLQIKEDPNREHISISVSDTGTGIPDQELHHIFDRFYQASNANTEDVTGTGIGLALVKELVELHKGNVTVQSEVGRGTTFEILLPLGKEHLNADEILGISSPKQEPQAPLEIVSAPNSEVPADREKEEGLPILLLIEDNEDLRNYIREILGNSYHIIEAANGKEGLAMAIEHIPDIVLSDLMMPKMDGLQVCKRLKEDMLTSHIPVILLTAKSARENRIEGLKSLADDYLTKPFNTEELLVRLQNLLEIRKKLQAKFSAGDVLQPKKIQLSSMDAIFMEKVTEQLEAEISNSLFGVVELAYAVGLSRSQLFRKIKAITNLTPNEFIRSFRLHRAMDMLRQQSATVSEVAYETGFQNPSYFSKCFNEQFGILPSSVSRQ
jgi:DNA-binding response OmpR family regulator/nitrogen-specific signal transduction histidine kinase